jgi:cystathionine gamma-synthase
MRDLTAVERSFSPSTKLVWIETPSNPMLNVVDISELSRIAHAHGALSVVDNTFLSPAQQQPFALGADISVHSTTKYLNGHSDVVGGAVVARTPELAERIQWLCNTLGQAAAPFDCWLVLRGIKTLSVRLRQHQDNALKIATFLEAHPRVSRTFYPGLKSHPDYELACRQQSGFGGIVSFELDGTLDDVHALLRNVKVFALAESLGGIESLIDHPLSMTHASMRADRREAAGISERIIRLSVGIEDCDDLIEDLQRALDASGRRTTTPAKEGLYVTAG